MADDKNSQSEPKAKAKASAKTKRNTEEKLDEIADKFSSAMSEGVKKMEEAFDKASDRVKSNPQLSADRIKGFFGTASGAGVLIIVGISWFLYTIGFFSHWIFPILLVAFGIFLLYRQKGT